MKTETIIMKIDKETKEKLQETALNYETTLSGLMRDLTCRECNLNPVEIWVIGYLYITMKHPNTGKKIIKRDNKYYCEPLDTYFEYKSLLLVDIKKESDVKLPFINYLIDNFDMFVKYLGELNLYEEVM